MGIAFVDEQHNDTLSTTSFSPAFTLSNGNTAVLVVGCGSGLGVTNVTDSGGSSWSRQTSNGGVVEVWATLSAIASTSITITCGSQPLDVSMMRYTGVTLLGNVANGTATGTNPTVSLTLQESGNYISGGWTTNGVATSVTAQNGTIRLNNFNFNQASLTNTSIDNTGSAGSITISTTHTGSVTWWIGAVELRATTTTITGLRPAICL